MDPVGDRATDMQPVKTRIEIPSRLLSMRMTRTGRDRIGDASAAFAKFHKVWIGIVPIGEGALIELEFNADRFAGSEMDFLERSEFPERAK